jgi:mannose-6-phosphate isomerase-like protein (cupin superfamily)
MSQICNWDEFPIVDYLPGVERQAVCGQRVMLTRIRYAKGVVVPEHKHDDVEQLMLIVQGRLWAKVGDEEKEVGPGTILVVPLGVMHAFRQVGEEEVVFHECFAPIRLEYLIGYKGPDPALEMIRKQRPKVD